MTATAVCPPPQTLALQAGKAAYSAVGFPALTLASLETSLAGVELAPPAQLVASPLAATQGVASAGAEPADTLIDLLRIAAGLVSLAVGFALWPFWLISLPVTFPILWGTGSQDATSIVGLVLDVFLGPLLLYQWVDNLFPPSSAATVNPSASAARSLATPADSLSDTASGSADEPAIQFAATQDSNFTVQEVRADTPTTQSGTLVSATESTQNPLAEALKVGLGLAFAPVWYLGALVTVPITLAIQLNYLMSPTLSNSLSSALPVATALTPISWPVAPFTLVSDFVDTLFPAAIQSKTPGSASAVEASDNMTTDRVKHTAHADRSARLQRNGGVTGGRSEALRLSAPQPATTNLERSASFADESVVGERASRIRVSPDARVAPSASAITDGSTAAGNEKTGTRPGNERLRRR